jgi:Protein of unknown function (DUF3606)
MIIKTDDEGRRASDLIDLGDEYQVSQWTEIFDVSRAELSAAIHIVGQRSSDVKRYIRARKPH